MRQTLKHARETKQTFDARKSNRREYSDEEKRRAVAAALVANRDKPTGAAAHKAAQEALGEPIHVSTLYDWTKVYGAEILASMPSPAATREIVKGTLEKWARLEDAALDELLKPNRLTNARVTEVVIAGGTARDKQDKAMNYPADLLAALERVIGGCTLRQVDIVTALNDIADHLYNTAPRLADIARLGSGDDAAASEGDGQS